MTKSYSNQFPIGNAPVGNKPKETVLYNVEIWSGNRLVQTIYLNAPYAICVATRKKHVGAKIVPVK